MAETSPAPSESGTTPSLTSTAAFEDHQVTVIERARAHPHQDLLWRGARIWSRSEHDTVDAAEIIDAIGFHLFLPWTENTALVMGGSC
jgi:hypothetical protein